MQTTFKKKGLSTDDLQLDPEAGLSKQRFKIAYSKHQKTQMKAAILINMQEFSNEKLPKGNISSESPQLLSNVMIGEEWT